MQRTRAAISAVVGSLLAPVLALAQDGAGSAPAGPRIGWGWLWAVAAVAIVIALVRIFASPDRAREASRSRAVRRPGGGP